MGNLSVLLAGGGSGGHLFPGIALAEELQQQSATVRFICSDRPVDQAILMPTRFGFTQLPSVSSARLWRHPLRFLRGLRETRRRAGAMLDQWRPNVVIGLGGFASFPVVQAAAQRRIPIVLLEQNLIPGRATRWLARKATVICTSFDETRSHLPRRAKVVFTGNPIRCDFQQPEGLRIAKESTGRSRLLILGGSQGAIAFNDIVLRALAELREELANWDITHQTGERHRAAVEAAYRDQQHPVEVQPFFADLPSRLQQTDLVISRAGATTLAELACVGCPGILIPDPHALSNHQWHNARFYAAQGAARLIDQNEEATAKLQSILQELLPAADQRSTMQTRMLSLAHPTAASRVREVIAEILP